MATKLGSTHVHSYKNQSVGNASLQPVDCLCFVIIDQEETRLSQSYSVLISCRYVHTLSPSLSPSIIYSFSEKKRRENIFLFISIH